MAAYNTISLAIYGTVLNFDVPRPYPPIQAPPVAFPQSASVDDLLSGAAWKDTLSSSIGGTGPYIPKILLGKIDTDEMRESRRQYAQEEMRKEKVQKRILAVKLIRKEGLVTDQVAEELESKVHDEHGASAAANVADLAFMTQVAPILCAAMK
jgi:hypothetical protein